MKHLPLVMLTLLLHDPTSDARDCVHAGRIPANRIPESRDQDYQFLKITTPEGIDPQVGALAIMPDGRVVVAFHRGEIYTYDIARSRWKLFASGLHEPLGLHVIDDYRVLVTQKPELTELIDSDRDGEADFYKNRCDDFGMTGNYHEFVYGPVKDSKGNLYIALNGSHKAHGMLKEIRGEVSPIGLPRAEFYIDDWKATERKLNFMFSNVPYRGCMLKIDPAGKATPFAYGLRSPCGIMIDDRDRIFVSDNQGDWVGTSKFFHIEEGKFYGHPASLIWKPGWTEDPFKMKVADLDKLRTKASIMLPHGSLSASPTQPILIGAGGRFGPFEGQILMGEMNMPKIFRLMPETVQGQVQGAVTTMFEGSISKGTGRLVFDQAGNLWIGRTSLGWAGGRGLTRVKWTGETSARIQNMRLTKRGFRLTFTQKMHPKALQDLSKYQCRCYTYLYRKGYGSPRVEKKKIEIVAVRVLDAGKTVELELSELIEERVFQLNMPKLVSAAGQELIQPVIYYTLNKRLK